VGGNLIRSFVGFLKSRSRCLQEHDKDNERVCLCSIARISTIVGSRAPAGEMEEDGGVQSDFNVW